MRRVRVLFEAISPSVGIYRRELPAGLISFSSAQGRTLFKEALKEGGCEGYFSLAEQFHTQDEPAYCGLGSLSMVLNTLNIVDRTQVVKHNVRYLTERNLDVHKPLEVVRKSGITFDEFQCMAAMNGASVAAKRAESRTFAEFERDVRSVTMSPSLKEALVLTFSRRSLGQTGDGHFSPLAALHPSRGLCLVLDTARFKYPPYWVEMSALWESMLSHDAETGRSRGWFLLSKHHTPPVTRLARSTIPWGSAKDMVLNKMPAAVAGCGTPQAVAAAVLGTLASDKPLMRALLGGECGTEAPPCCGHAELCTCESVLGDGASQDASAREALRRQLERTASLEYTKRVFAEDDGLRSLYGSPNLAALLVAAWPLPDTCAASPAVRLLQSLACGDEDQSILRNEVASIADRLSIISGRECSCDIHIPSQP